MASKKTQRRARPVWGHVSDGRSLGSAVSSKTEALQLAAFMLKTGEREVRITVEVKQ